MTAGAQVQIPNRWDESACVNCSEQDLLLYRSRVLGSDRRVTFAAGGPAAVASLSRCRGRPRSVRPPPAGGHKGRPYGAHRGKD